MAQLLRIGGAGAAGPAGSSGSGAPAAPNVTSATVAVSFAPYANDQKVIFSGSFNLPTSDPNYNQDQQIVISAVDPSGNIFSVASFTGTPVGSPTSYSNVNGPVIPQPATTQTWKLVFQPYNSVGNPTTGPYTITGISVPAAGVVSVTASETPSQRIADPATRLISCFPKFIPVLVGSQVPQNVTVWISKDNGANFIGIGWQLMSTVGQTLSVSEIAPSVTQTWVIACLAGAVNVDPFSTIPAANLPAGTVLSSGFSVVALLLPAATLLSTLTVSSGAGGTFPYNVFRADGSQYFSIPSISYNDTPCVADPNAFAVRITTQDYNASGTSVGPEHDFAGVGITVGQVETFGPLQGSYGTDGFSYTRTGNIAKIRFRVYVCNRVDQSPTSFSNALCAVLQTGIGSGAGFLDVTVASGGAIPAGVPGDGAAPNQFLALLVTSAWSTTNEGELDLFISPTPPGSLGTTIGGHIYLEIPDVSTVGLFTAGTSTAGSTDVSGSQWSLFDAGQFSYVANQQPWIVKLPNAQALLWPDGTPQVETIRIYVQAYSALVDAQPVQANQSGPTLSTTYSVVPQTSIKPGSGSSVTGIQPNTISASVGSPVTVGGQSQTPILVTVTPPSPVPSAWAFEVYAYVNGDITTQPIFQSAPFTAAQSGALLSNGQDGISTPHTFAPTTPTSVTSVTLYAVAGLIRGGAPILSAGNGNNVKSATVFVANQIIPGITPSCVISIGTATGVLDPTQLIQALLDASVGTLAGVFGVTTSGITNSKLASNAVGTSNVQSGAITNPLLAALAVANANIQSASVALANMQASSVGSSQYIGGSVNNAALAAASIALANMQTGSVSTSQYVSASIPTAAIANAAITGALIASATITNANIQSGTITTALIANAAITTALIANAAITTALIANLAVTDAQIANLSASKLIAGAITVTGSTGLSVLMSGSSDRTNLYSNLIQLINSSGVSTVLITDGNVFVNNTSGANNVELVGSGTDGPGGNGVYITAFQVLCSRRTGPGTPSFASFSDVQTWCQNLYNALKSGTGHGLLT